MAAVIRAADKTLKIPPSMINLYGEMLQTPLQRRDFSKITMIL